MEKPEVAVRSLAQFLRSLAVLAMDAQGQLEWLRSLGLGEPGIADEVALEFDDGHRLMWAFVGYGWLPEEAREPIDAIDLLLDAMSDPELKGNVWDVESLGTDPRWEQARGLARTALLRIT